jgi:transcriptional regulator with XRE-family HTH domain
MYEKPIATFAERLRQTMDIKNITAAEISRGSSISTAAISRYLKGDYVPKQDNTFALAQFLHVSPAWLMGYDVDMNGMIDERHQLLTKEENQRKADMFEIDDVFPRSVQRKLSNCLDTMYELLQLDCEKKSDNELLKNYHSLDQSSQALIKDMIDKLLLTQQMAQKNTAQTGGESTQKGTPSLQQVPSREKVK